MWLRMLCSLIAIGMVACLSTMSPVFSSKDCPSTCTCENLKMDCFAKNLSEIPVIRLDHWITHLDLRMNSISNLTSSTFSQTTNSPHVTELLLGDNRIQELPVGVFSALINLRTLKLNNNHLKIINDRAFSGLASLVELITKLHLSDNMYKDLCLTVVDTTDLDSNVISHIARDSFCELTSLQRLRLSNNSLCTIPTVAMSHVSTLRYLWLKNNRISSIPANAFKSLHYLQFLTLNSNLISHINKRAFIDLTGIETMDLSNNQLEIFPEALYTLTTLKDLLLAGNQIQYLPDRLFAPGSCIERIVTENNLITNIHHNAFTNLTHLKKIVLSGVRDLTTYPDLTGCSDVQFIRIDRSSLKSLPNNLCLHTRKLTHFDIHSNHISSIPDLSMCVHLRILNLANNQIMSLDGVSFSGLSQLNDLTLSHNKITSLPRNIFHGLERLVYLNLGHNKITFIDDTAFSQLAALRDLNLVDNSFPHLPTSGLSNLRVLKTYMNPALENFPTPEHFPHAREFMLSYAYHCCEYMSNDTNQQSKDAEKLSEEEIMWSNQYDGDLSKDQAHIQWLDRREWDPSIFTNLSQRWTAHVDNDTLATDLADEVYYSMGHGLPDYLPEAATDYFSDYQDASGETIAVPLPPPTQCTPKPGPFLPCLDLFGWWSLRCGVWLMFTLALIGNGVVLFVALFTSRSKMDVTRFLIYNLAAADFLMSIYLGILAMVDAYTLGEFKKHAVAWQRSDGCKTAGFLAVVSSEMSVFVLAVITLERFYAITHAMQLNKRLNLRHASYIMIGGWLVSVIIAALPLVGISDYRIFAVCLPFEISDTPSIAYVCFIMVFNATSFLIIISCYMKMYWSIRGTQTWNSSDMRVAKRMALLVFTDFACWAPITFFSLTAAFGVQLISLEDAKIFTIFVLPLNSCANPFLYAICTKQFKRDCVHLCKRIEESSISRRLTNFSTRQFSWSWITSRRTSASNGILQSERRISVSNSTANNALNMFDLRLMQRRALITVEENPDGGLDE